MSLRGMGAAESPNSRRDLVVPHTTAQSHDTNGRAGQPSNMEERLPVSTQRKKQKKQRIRSTDETDETETRSFLVL
jgi:hypothetical protein